MEKTKTHPKHTNKYSKIVSRAPVGPLGDPSGNMPLFWGRFLIDCFCFFTDFWGPWGPSFSHLFGPNWKTLFWTPFAIALKTLGPTLAPFWEPFWNLFGTFLGYFLGVGVRMKIELPSRRELNFQGPGTTKINTFSVLFLYLLWEHLLRLFFDDFCRF